MYYFCGKIYRSKIWKYLEGSLKIWDFLYKDYWNPDINKLPSYSLFLFMPQNPSFRAPGPLVILPWCWHSCVGLSFPLVSKKSRCFLEIDLTTTRVVALPPCSGLRDSSYSHKGSLSYFPLFMLELWP